MVSSIPTLLALDPQITCSHSIEALPCLDCLSLHCLLCLGLLSTVVEKEVRRTVNGSISVLTEKVAGVAQTLAGNGPSLPETAGPAPSAEEGVPPAAATELAAGVEQPSEGT